MVVLFTFHSPVSVHLTDFGTTGKLADFETLLTFVVDSARSQIHADGLSFFISPFDVSKLMILLLVQVEKLGCDVEHLKFGNHPDLEEIWLGCNSKYQTDFSSFEETHSKSVANLEHIWNLNPDEILSLRDLQQVSISNCQTLKSLFPTSLATHLVTLDVRAYATLVEIFVEGERAFEGDVKNLRLTD
ncbi:uncharacterized protein HKW66_Vig0113480 [Vigna angularis]|uniref:Disease resistance protein At4g27190-like leucine-rich repeats domain-containing protein n=1 Tax=Phaseolus angularis TaxID=3914 RepID=A0A8T0KXH9_PHAAN|nr:uncharacterized protein HKW66_Vig0113480 [Vigna angularis]